MADGLPLGIAVGGDLASDHLDRGYALLGRASAPHASVVGAVVLEPMETAKAPWARLLSIKAAGRRGGLAQAVSEALTHIERVDLWLQGATEQHGRAHEQAVTHPALRSSRTVAARQSLGDAAGSGPAIVALGAAVIARGEAQTVLVTSVAQDGSAVATVLGRA
jgi:hypothetical protein